MSAKWIAYILSTGEPNWHTKAIYCSLLHKDELQEETKNWKN
jgi:hypothetical protein